MKLSANNIHTSGQLGTFVPVEGEINYDTTNKTLSVGDGSTAGGTRMSSAGSPTWGKATTNDGTTDAMTLTDSDGAEVAAIDSNGQMDLAAGLDAEGPLEGKATTNDGSTDVLNLTDSDDVEIAAIDSNGQMDLAGGLDAEGLLEGKATTNDGTTDVINLTDSDGVEIAAIDSNGQMDLAGGLDAEGLIEGKATTNDGTTDVLNLTDSDDAEVAAIDSDGNLDLGGVSRALTSLYRRYYHVPATSQNPGASGATWTAPSANGVGGYQLDAAGEVLYFGADVHADWDGATDLTVEVHFQVNVDNTLGAAEDTVDLKLVCYYMGTGETATKTQTVENAVTVGACAQYTMFKTEFTIDWDLADNVVQAGDKFGFALNLETDTSEVDNIIINLGGTSMYYSTTHSGIESGDV